MDELADAGAGLGRQQCRRITQDGQPSVVVYRVLTWGVLYRSARQQQTVPAL